jgi:DNA-directed RNA polymerase specialized sigma24 family protein
MVLRVSRRLLGDAHEAEDVFQATFLVLARRASAIRRRDSLAAWLHGVAYRLAAKALAARTRRQQHEVACAAPDPADPGDDPLAQLTARELVSVSDGELQRLPEAYRLPVILCCLESRTIVELITRQLNHEVVRKTIQISTNSSIQLLRFHAVQGGEVAAEAR